MTFPLNSGLGMRLCFGTKPVFFENQNIKKE